MTWTPGRSNRSVCCREGSPNSETRIQNSPTASYSTSYRELMSEYPVSYRDPSAIAESFHRSNSVKQHIQTSRGLFPHKRIIRKSEMTSKGLVVTEVQEEVSGLPSTSGPPSPDAVASSAASTKSDGSSGARKSPIAELLYMRWLEGLKLKWPSLM